MPRTSTPSVTRISLAAAAEKNGISVKTLRRRISDGSLPAHRLQAGPGKKPRLILVDPADVEALLRPVPAATSSR